MINQKMRLILFLFLLQLRLSNIADYFLDLLRCNGDLIPEAADNYLTINRPFFEPFNSIRLH